MRVKQYNISLQARNRGYHLVSSEIVRQCPELANFKSGLVHIHIMHTSAGLTLNENADPSVRSDFETFFKDAPGMNPSRTLIQGVVCGVRVEDVQDPTMREIRYLDKLVDELAKGKTMEKILRS